MKTLGDTMTNEQAKESFNQYAGNKNYLTFEDFLKIFNGE
jgi:Ca2+-binding EF-hand superfamily protein